jgi:PIN domain nuclease of toxin-antitoxin system
MILLVDAHALLWALMADPKLTPDARRALESPDHDVLVSAATVWELAIKRAAGRLRAPSDLVAAIDATNFGGVPVTLADAELAAALPPHHRDPFDRMLVAQARRLGAVIVTRDEVFALYGVETLTA